MFIYDERKLNEFKRKVLETSEHKTMQDAKNSKTTIYVLKITNVNRINPYPKIYY